jgi:hypothetical protein
VTLGIIAFIANDVAHIVEVKQELITNIKDHQTTFIDLCDSSSKDGTSQNFVHPSTFAHLNCSIYVGLMIFLNPLNIMLLCTHLLCLV